MSAPQARRADKGEPADPITAAAELAKRGDLTKTGGAGYLHTLVQAGTRITQLGYSARGEPDDVRSAAEAEVLDALATREQTAAREPRAPPQADPREPAVRSGACR